MHRETLKLAGIFTEHFPKSRFPTVPANRAPKGSRATFCLNRPGVPDAVARGSRK
jgi:hypothetical protein